MTFPAKYHGTCSDCDGHISPGDELTFTDDAVVHAHCDPLEPAPRPVCPNCFLAIPVSGKCDCEE